MKLERVIFGFAIIVGCICFYLVNFFSSSISIKTEPNKSLTLGYKDGTKLVNINISSKYLYGAKSSKKNGESISKYLDNTLIKANPFKKINLREYEISNDDELINFDKLDNYVYSSVALINEDNPSPILIEYKISESSLDYLGNSLGKQSEKFISGKFNSNFNTVNYYVEHKKEDENDFYVSAGYIELGDICFAIEIYYDGSSINLNDIKEILQRLYDDVDILYTSNDEHENSNSGNNGDSNKPSNNDPQNPDTPLKNYTFKCETDAVTGYQNIIDNTFVEYGYSLTKGINLTFENDICIKYVGIETKKYNTKNEYLKAYQSSTCSTNPNSYECSGTKFNEENLIITTYMGNDYPLLDGNENTFIGKSRNEATRIIGNFVPEYRCRVE